MKKNYFIRRSMAVAAVAFWGVMVPFAQGADDIANGGKDDLAQPQRFANLLRPTRKSAAVISNQPYQPIRKTDDQADIPEIEMFVGESRVFPAPGVARIAVGNGQIMSATSLDNKEVLIFANAVGTSSLFVWNEDGRYQRVKINVVPGDTTRYAREIAAFLSGIPNAKASIIGDKVIVEGDNLRDADLAKIEELGKRYPQIVNFTNRIGWEQMVLFDVKVVEFPKNELREIGVKWNPQGGAVIGGIWGPITRRNTNNLYQINQQTDSNNQPPISGPGGPGTPAIIPNSPQILSAINIGLNAQLNLLAQDGKASILAEPQLSARNGAKASFLAGGEYPYSVSTINGVTVIFKPYGIKLDVTPHVDRHGVIRANIESEVSAIDTSLSTVAGPALSTRRSSTEFNVHSGETIVLAGLLSRKMSSDIDKVPLLGDIPILGALFRSKRFQRDETELVVFVTPIIVDANSPGLADRVDKATSRLQEELGAAPYLDEPLGAKDPAATSKPTDTPPAAGGIEPARIANLPAPVVPEPAASVNLLPADANPLAPAKAFTPNLRVRRDGVPLRSEPNGHSAVLVLLDKGSIVSPGDKEMRGGWHHVIVGSAEGWMADKWLEPTGQTPIIVRHGEPNGNAAHALGALPEALAVTANERNGGAAAIRYRVAQDHLALRVAPDVNAQVLQYLAFDTAAEKLPQPPHQGWVAVRVGDRTGWVAGRLLVAERTESR